MWDNFYSGVLYVTFSCYFVLSLLLGCLEWLLNKLFCSCTLRTLYSQVRRRHAMTFALGHIERYCKPEILFAWQSTTIVEGIIYKVIYTEVHVKVWRLIYSFQHNLIKAYTQLSSIEIFSHPGFLHAQHKFTVEREM